jgi:hypothetical protein
MSHDQGEHGWYKQKKKNIARKNEKSRERRWEVFEGKGSARNDE